MTKTRFRLFGIGRGWVLAITVTVMLLQIAWAAATQAPKPAGRLGIEKVKDDLYLISGEGGNVAVYVTNEGVVLVDDMFDRNHADVLAQVKSVTNQPLRYVFNTHQHDDHAGGNSKMLPIAEVVAHRNVRENLSAKRQPFYEDTPGTPIGLPKVTFTREVSVFLGGKEVRAMHFGRGHTNGDAIIYFPDLKVIHTGDLFLGLRRGESAPLDMKIAGRVFIDFAQGGSLLEWTKTLDQVLATDFDMVIPGHGIVSKKEDLSRFRSALDAMQKRLADLVKQRKSKEEIVKVLENDYGWRVAGCPPSPPTGGCLQFQQVDGLIRELMR
jgi:glyoxylase-like metal-dependent hydrolase (beta-lactamase superfamily II)